MKGKFVLGLLASSLALVAMTETPAAERKFRPDDHFRLRSASDVTISPDGSTVAFVEQFVDREANRSRSQIWLLSLADGKLSRLSDERANDRTPRFSPDGKSIAYLTGGGAAGPGPGGPAKLTNIPGIVVVRLGTGTKEIVATYEQGNDTLAYQGVGNQLSWSPDGKALAYLSADPGPEAPPGDPMVITRYSYKSWASMNDNRRWHVYMVTLASKDVKRLTEGPYYEHSLAWSPSGAEIAFVSNREEHYDRVHNYDLFTVRISDGHIRRLTNTKGSEYTPTWSPDGRRIAFRAGTRSVTTRESSAEDPHVWVMPAEGGTASELAPNLDRRVMAVAWAPDSPIVYFTAEDRGSTVLYRVNADGGDPVAVMDEPGLVGDFSVAASGVTAFAFTSLSSPAEVYVQDRATPARQVTRLNADLLAEREISVTEAFDFASFDDTPAQGFLVPPGGFEPGRKYPVILRIHGGPHHQQGYGFEHWNQLYAGEGYAVVMINYRGSSGYGQKFTDGTVEDQNGAEAKDVLAGLDYILAETPYLDRNRMGVEGGSYGGQLTNWIITQTDRFKSAVPQSSISNLISLGYTIWAQDYIEVEFGGHPWEKDIARFMWERSPLAHVANVKTPTMFIHGEEDQDVNVVEAEQMYIALKQVGVDTVFVRYPREGHGLSEPAHAVDGMERALGWHDQFLKNETNKATP